MQTYSTIVVIDSLLKNDEIENTIEKIKRNIKNNGGEIIEEDRWGKKRLAYEIKKRQYGYYVEFIFKAKGDVIKIIEREYGLDEHILRYLTIRLNKKALQYREQKKQQSVEKNVEKVKPAEKVEEKTAEKVEAPVAEDIPVVEAKEAASE